MKAVFQISHIKGALADLLSIVPKQAPYPITEYIHIRQANEQEAFLTATNTDIEVSVLCPVKWRDIGEAVIPARKLAAVCKRLDDKDGAQITITALDQKGRGEITGRGVRGTFALMSPYDFPFMAFDKPDIDIYISSDRLAWALDRTAFAAGKDDIRQVLNGVLLHLRGQEIIAVATDGYRLAEARIDLKDAGNTPQPETAPDAHLSPMPEDAQIIIPTKSVAVIRKLLRSYQGAVRLACTSNHLRIIAPPHTITSKLIQDRYPDYARVIPRAETDGAALPVPDLLRVAQIVKAVSEGNKRLPRLELAFSAAGLTARYDDTGGDYIESKIPVEWKQDGGIVTAFNALFVLDVLGQAGDTIHCHLTRPDAPSLWTLPDDPAVRYVIMPMR